MPRSRFFGERNLTYFGMPRHGKFVTEVFINLPNEDAGDISSDIQ
jgi:hypothetical protein